MTTDTQLAPTDAEIVALMGDPRYSTICAVREAISRCGSPSTPSSAAEFALQALVSAGHVSQELVDKAMALPGAPQPAHSGEHVDRADAVNLARNTLTQHDSVITKKGVRVLAEAVLSMDAAINAARKQGANHDQ